MRRTILSILCLLAASSAPLLANATSAPFPLSRISAIAADATGTIWFTLQDRTGIGYIAPSGCAFKIGLHGQPGKIAVDEKGEAVVTIPTQHAIAYIHDNLVGYLTLPKAFFGDMFVLAMPDDAFWVLPRVGTEALLIRNGAIERKIAYSTQNVVIDSAEVLGAHEIVFSARGELSRLDTDDGSTALLTNIGTPVSQIASADDGSIWLAQPAAHRIGVVRRGAGSVTWIPFDRPIGAITAATNRDLMIGTRSAIVTISRSGQTLASYSVPTTGSQTVTSLVRTGAVLWYAAEVGDLGYVQMQTGRSEAYNVKDRLEASLWTCNASLLPTP